MQKMNSYQKGRWGEKIAQEYLQKKGYKILATNYKTRGAEVDILAQDSNELVAVEIKSGNQVEENVGEKVATHKKQKIEQAVEEFLYRQGIANIPVRFEVICISSEGGIHHYCEEFLDF